MDVVPEEGQVEDAKKKTNEKQWELMTYPFQKNHVSFRANLWCCF